MNRKYKLETAGCTDKPAALRAIMNCVGSLEVANTMLEKQELEADPEHPNYRQMIDDLDAVNIQVFDYERVQTPKFEGISHEPTCYT